MLKLRVRPVDIEPAVPIAILNEEDAKEMGVIASDRVKLNLRGKWVSVIVDVSRRLIGQGEIGVDKEVVKLGARPNSLVEVVPAAKPKSIEFIKKKLSGIELKKEEVEAIIDDIYRNNLSDIELGAFISAVYTHGYSSNETLWVTKRMIENGEKLTWPPGKIVVQEHTVGGVPGNRVTLIMVPILAKAGLLIPKTSSRAITSPAGTADTVEVLAPVSLSASQIKRVVERTGGCMVWGGAVDLAPVDDKLIRAEYPLSLDPEGQVLASVMSKNAATGAKYLLMDIPFGAGSKVGKLEHARSLARKFKQLGEKLGMKVECAITKGEQPIGNGIGPVLEMIDCMNVLKGRGPGDLRRKSIELAGILLRMTGKGDARRAEKILDSGQALEKFREIIRAQGGDPDKPLERMLGKFVRTVYAEKSGTVLRIKNEDVSRIAKAAGAPKDIGAGVYIYVKTGQIVQRGDKLFEIYAEKKYKADEAEKILADLEPITIGSPEELLVEEV